MPDERVTDGAVRRYLLDPGELTPKTLEQTLAHAWSRACDYADVYLQHSQHESLTIENGIVKDAAFTLEQGAGVRAALGEKTGFAYSEELSPDQLLEAARAARSIAHGNRQARLPQSSSTPPPAVYAYDNPLQDLGMEQKIALLREVDETARGLAPEVKKVTATLASAYEVILIASTEGVYQTDIRPLVRLSVSVIAERDGRREIGGHGGGGRYGYSRLLETGAPARFAQEAVRVALLNLESQEAPAGTMTVVLGHGWPGVLLHEAIGHGLEGDAIRKGTSAFTHLMGQRVASPEVTVVDNGTLPDRRGSLCMDDEGTPTQNTVLIEDGIIRGFLYDRLNARLCKTESTGNGRRESYAHQPMPRMTNTYMQAGTHSPEEILESVDHGLYAVGFNGGQVDITSGKFVFSASEAYLIKDGKIAHPVKGATLIGDGPSVLQRVSMVGDDLELDDGIGTCGKDGQQVPVGVGQPTLRVDELTVGGTRMHDG